MYEKLMLVILGAVFAKLFDLYIQSRKIDKLQQALYEELDDVKDRLKLICGSYGRSLQAYAIGGIDYEVPLRLNNPVFQKHYTDLALKFGSSQRKSFSLISAYIDGVNRGIERLENELLGAMEERTTEGLERWGNSLKTQYKNAAIAFWHIGYHLDNRDLPFLGEEGTEVHKTYIEYLKSVDDRLEKIVDQARKNLTRKSFE